MWNLRANLCFFFCRIKFYPRTKHVYPQKRSLINLNLLQYWSLFKYRNAPFNGWRFFIYMNVAQQWGDIRAVRASYKIVWEPSSYGESWLVRRTPKEIYMMSRYIAGIYNTYSGSNKEPQQLCPRYPIRYRCPCSSHILYSSLHRWWWRRRSSLSPRHRDSDTSSRTQVSNLLFSIPRSSHSHQTQRLSRGATIALRQRSRWRRFLAAIHVISPPALATMNSRCPWWS